MTKSTYQHTIHLNGSMHSLLLDLCCKTKRPLSDLVEELLTEALTSRGIDVSYKVQQYQPSSTDKPKRAKPIFAWK